MNNKKEEGKGLLQENRYNEAIECFINCIKENPHDFETRVHLGIAYLLNGTAAPFLENHVELLPLVKKENENSRLFNLYKKLCSKVAGGALILSMGMVPALSSCEKSKKEEAKNPVKVEKKIIKELKKPEVKPEVKPVVIKPEVKPVVKPVVIKPEVKPDKTMAASVNTDNNANAVIKKPEVKKPVVKKPIMKRRTKYRAAKKYGGRRMKYRASKSIDLLL
jgi:tetratricopeptide (TPR) repeat protein